MRETSIALTQQLYTIGVMYFPPKRQAEAMTLNIQFEMAVLVFLISFLFTVPRKCFSALGGWKAE